MDPFIHGIRGEGLRLLPREASAVTEKTAKILKFEPYPEEPLFAQVMERWHEEERKEGKRGGPPVPFRPVERERIEWPARS